MREGSAADALRIFRKEVVGAARDRHTLLHTVAVPLLVYPLLFLGTAQWMVYRKGVEENATYRVLLLGDALPPPLGEKLVRAGGLGVERETGEAGKGGGGGGGGGEADLERARASLLRGEADVVLAPGESGTLRLYFDSGGERSESGRRRVERALEGAGEEARRDAAADRGFDPTELEVASVRREDLASPEEAGRRVLGALLPVLLLVMSVTGAFGLAVDVTAGEKERRTAETTLLLPVPSRAVFAGKFLAVLAAGGLASALNLASMLLASRAFLGGLGERSLAVHVPPASLALVLLVCLLFLASAVSLLLGVALFARTFREGQSYLTPLLTLFILVPMLAFQPGARLTGATALVPIVNATFALRETLEGSISPGPFLLALAAMAVYGALAFALAARLHARAELHLAEEALPLRRFGAWLRRPEAVA
ncbi:MAG TPA: ABC transporter permease subunit [Planctomycetota bacterium]|nr:ABC transporter permease subunit [Planctomycetota bacterium]